MMELWYITVHLYNSTLMSTNTAPFVGLVPDPVVDLELVMIGDPKNPDQTT